MKTLLVMSNSTDIRAFCFSGLAARLAQYTPVVLGLTSRHQLLSVPGECQSKVFEPGTCELPRPLKLLRRSGEHITRTRIAGEGQSVWVNFRSRLKQPSAASSGLRSVMAAVASRFDRPILAVERLALARMPGSGELKRYLRDEGIGVVVLSSMASDRDVEIVRTSRQLGLLTIVALNSPKDVFSRPHTPVWPTYLFVPSEEAIQHLGKYNRLSGSARVVYAKSLHLSALKVAHELRLDRAAFCSLYKFDPLRPIVCYTAAAPAAVGDELPLVAEIARKLATISPDERPQLLVRLNPMEDRPERWNCLREPGRIDIQVPLWKWEPDDLWSEPLSEDGHLWASTIEHSAANLSIPSTVTSEFLEFGKPVINICFDSADRAGEHAHQSNLRYWDAGFYKEFRSLAGVFPALSAFHAVDLVSRVVPATGGVMTPATPAWSLPETPDALHQITELVQSAASGRTSRIATVSSSRLPA